MSFSLVWQLIFETLRWQPDPDRLAHFATQQPDIRTFQSVCSAHGLLPIVDKALSPVRQALFAAEEAEVWRRAVSSRVLVNLVMHRELERILQLFATAQIQVVPFKGPTLSERLYGDPALRVYSDLDLLVSTDHVHDAVNLLMGEGYRPDLDSAALAQQVKPGSREIHCALRNPSSNFIVELHWLLFSTWQRRRALPMDIDDWLRADSADNEELLLYLCLHGSKHWWTQMKWVVDVDRCVRTAQGLDWDKLFSTAKSRGWFRALRLGLFLAKKVCDLEMPGIAEIELRRDRSLDSLAKSVSSYWDQPDSSQPLYHWKVCYLLNCRDDLFDRVKMVKDYALMRFSDMCVRH